jgi:hypothetical protein
MPCRGFKLTGITWTGENKMHRDVLVKTHVNKLLKDKSFGQLEAKAYACIAVIKSCFIGDDCA